MTPRLNVTFPTALVLQALAAGAHYGFDIMDVTGLPSGTVYPILRRLDRAALAVSSWEAEEVAHQEQRPARRYYRITPAGHSMLRECRARFPVLGAGALGTRRLEPAEG